MGAVDKFLFKLENFDKENIPAKVIKALQPYLKVKYIEILFVLFGEMPCLWQWQWQWQCHSFDCVTPQTYWS